MAEALSHIQENRIFIFAMPILLSHSLSNSNSLSLSLSLSLSEYIKSAPAEEIFEKSKVENFYKYMSRNS